MGRLLPVKALPVLVKSDANNWSSRMQMGGQVHAITQNRGRVHDCTFQSWSQSVM